MSILGKSLYVVALGYLLSAVEFFLLQTIIWQFDVSLPGWIRMQISESKSYVFIANCILCYLMLYKPWQKFNDAKDEIE